MGSGSASSLIEAAPLEDAAGFLAVYQPFWERTLAELAGYVERPSPRKAPK